jgi:hypothetical protein
MSEKEYQVQRREAYPLFEEIVVALAEKEEGRPAMWEDMMAKRAIVRNTYPKV